MREERGVEPFDRAAFTSAGSVREVGCEVRTDSKEEEKECWEDGEGIREAVRSAAPAQASVGRHAPTFPLIRFSRPSLASSAPLAV